MNTVLIRERYKVVRVLYSEPDYAFVEAVDIQERETPTRQINLYEGELLHRYGRLCAGIDPADCPAFQGMFLCGDTLAAGTRGTGGPWPTGWRLSNWCCTARWKWQTCPPRSPARPC